MKKLLGILGTITIAGGGMVGLVANAQTLAKNEINYLKKSSNNLENLKRNKRQNINLEKENKLEKLSNEQTQNINLEKENIIKKDNLNNFTLSKTLNINYDVKKYFKELCLILTELAKKEVILSVNDDKNAPVSCNTNFFVLNRNTSFNYFRIPVLIDGRGLELVFRTSDLYLQGFINNIDNNNHTERHYWFFDDALIREINDVVENHNLGFDSNYNTLLPSNEANIGWTGIQDAFFQLTNIGTSRPPALAIIRGSLARVILATAESIRFRQVRNNIIENYDTQSPTSSWGHYRTIITNWGSITQDAINYLSQNGNLNNFVNIGNILIFSIAMYNHLNSCHILRSETCMEENGIHWNNLYHLDLQGWGNEKITLPNNVKVTSIKVLDKDSSENNNLKKGSIYVGTTNGVYFKSYNKNDNNNIMNFKFDDLNFPITDIELDNKGSAYVVNNKGEVYHLDLQGWGNEKITLPNNVKVTSIKVLQKNSESKSLGAGDIYFTTTNGVYLKHGAGQIDKFDDLNFPITDIELDNKGSAYVVNNKGEVYHLDLQGWGNEKITLPNNVKVTSIKVLQKNSESKSLGAGDIYFTTTNGVYLKHGAGQIDKFDDLNFPITDIELDNKGSAYVVNNKGEVYHLDLQGWGNEKITLPNNVKVTSIKVLQKNSESKSLGAGDIYFTTTNGVYLKHGAGQIDKFDDLNFPITDIELDNKGSIYIFII
ncbi:ribosome-inactivating family protein [Spiroplasma endosymbiont of Asaphidion curtum]|uniref:ribosome-inactivating family protein n=1 Tax=Spiroplasma endosymbiont of Asaphidion curtum TaxID=3066281 RepID=UPI00313F32AE